MTVVSLKNFLNDSYGKELFSEKKVATKGYTCLNNYICMIFFIMFPFFALLNNF